MFGVDPKKLSNEDMNRIRKEEDDILFEKMRARIRRSCWKKCISGFYEDRISPGESECIQKCVLKQIDVQTMLTSRLISTDKLIEEQAKALEELQKLKESMLSKRE